MVSLIDQTFSDCCGNDRKMKKAATVDFGQKSVGDFGSKSFSTTRSMDSSPRKFKRSYSSESDHSEKNQGELMTSGKYTTGRGSKDRSFMKSTKAGENPEMCCICMDEVTDPKKLKCGHVFCRDCIDMQFQYKPVCPRCGAVYGKIIGDQPPGTMGISNSRRSSLKGFGRCGIITILYSFPSGVQGVSY